MKIIDLFMLMLTFNAYRDLDTYSYIIFACAAVYVVARGLEVYRGRKEKKLLKENADPALKVRSVSVI